MSIAHMHVVDDQATRGSKPEHARLSVRLLPKALIERVSLLVLLLGVVLWSISLYQMQLVGIDHTWFPVPYMGIDFQVGTFEPARVWLEGDNPYDQQYQGIDLVYPPFVLRAFAWTGLFEFKQAYILFLVILASCVGLASWYAIQVRSDSVDRLVGPFTATAVMLFSTPVLFAMERGNYDLLVLPCLVAGAMLLRKNTITCDLFAGTLLAFAAWLKVYPALVGLVLVSNRRWHALSTFVLMGAFIALMDLPWLSDWARLNGDFTKKMMNLSAMTPDASINYWWHSFPSSWKNLFTYVPQPFKVLRAVPGTFATAAILFPLLSFTLWRFSKSANAEKLHYPLLLWVVALASFVPPVANDYSLAFLPLAALTLWKREDKWSVHLCMLLLLLWWQPFALPINGRVLFLFKVIGLFGTAGLLLRRLNELDAVCAESLISPNDRLRGASVS